MLATFHFPLRLLATLLLLLWAENALGAIGFVTSACNSAITGTQVVVTINTTAGHDVLVSISERPATATISSVTDTGGSTYASRIEVTSGGTAKLRAAVWSARNVAASTSVTVNFATSPTDMAVCVGDYSGVQQLGLTASATGASVTPSVSLTTQDANNFIVSGITPAAGATITQNSGTLRNQVGPTNGTNPVENALVDNTAASASSLTNSVTLSASHSWGAVALELRSVAPATTPHQLPTLGVGANVIPPCPSIPCSIDLNFQNLCSTTFSTNCVGGLQISHLDPATGSKVIDASVLLPLGVTYTVDPVGKDATGNAVVDPPAVLLVTLRPPI